MRGVINKSDIPVVIFVGGYGSRLKEKTLYKPKPMVEVGGVPLLWHIMKIYSHYGFNKFILTLGYKGDYIRDYLKGKGKKIFSEFEIDLVETGLETPTGGRLLKVTTHIKSDVFMCTYGDGVSNININALLAYHMSKKGEIGTLTGVRVPHKFGIITFTKDGNLESYRKGHLMSDYVFAGFMVLNKEFLNYLTEDMMIEDPFNNLGKDGKMAVYLHEGYFGAVDTFKELVDLNKAWDTDPKWKVW
ncbi:glucose-1-phosphate cytidylyltransferase [candidate division WWE3 bacterium CG08_land_8_20_14_0_20_40_13]|uniref:Glucose-1-phosphate cytidylyltransferase n=1 Tax=candidate division WWE3 bacterium CG08_land_8_20_14_0_20_40_13 TaxID=1975084 RepID=A0A2H0XGI0_UNCKA|nr:MAG: glucose-1-phosphate cytidylyltransferase [candidate division WWE3 bacterium CG08_land_8_20_14_0_20_40_13]